MTKAIEDKLKEKNTTLFVCHTLEAARTKFREYIKAYNAELTAHRILYSKMQIVFETSAYEFISKESIKK